MTSAFEKHGISHLSASSINLFIAQPAMWCVSYLMKRRTPCRASRTPWHRN